MSDKEKLERLHEIASREEDRYYELSHLCMKDKNTIGNMVNMAQATAFQRMRYTIEDMLNDSEVEE